MRDFASERDRMVDRQIVKRGIRSERVLAVMRRIPREEFVSRELRGQAYKDGPLPIEAGQTISQPFVVALMAEAAEVAPGDRVLEIGTGSGYAAAVLGALAERVYTVERHAELAETARTRLAALGSDNVEVRLGDGTLGWPEAAPFDAILAAAGGPEIPEVLKVQLAVGGRLVMPVGRDPGHQQLIKLTRRSTTEFATEDLGGVLFVPLVGAFGWSEGTDQPRADGTAGARLKRLSELIRAAAEPLPPIDDAGLGQMFERFGRGRIVGLGEASHGTSEFYLARAAMTKHLIEHQGFTIVAVEADWPDAAVFDRFVRGKPPGRDADQAFARFPTWMWRNAEVAEFLGWLRDHNRGRSREQQAGFYGLDLYSLNASIRAVIDYLDRVDPKAAKVARRRYGCLTPWQDKPHRYGSAAKQQGLAPCENAVVAILRDLLARQLRCSMEGDDASFDATENARLVRDAERYYRAMYYGSAESWNLRDRHMAETLDRLLDAAGPESKAVIWAHNSHIGDARDTEMGDRGEINLGQLLRETHGPDVALLGFGTHVGTVAAADDWDHPMQVKRINPSLPESFERLMHDAGVPRFLLDLRQGGYPGLRDVLSSARLERFIGLIYRPDAERHDHYLEASLARQFDGYVWLDETTAVTPLPVRERCGDEETFPFGL